MTPPTATVERLAADAAALVRVASPHDWLEGFVVVADRLPGRVVALAIGAGGGLASLYDTRGGGRGVVVDAWKLSRGHADTTRLSVAVEASTLHEAAHVLTATADATPERAAELLEGAGEAVEAISPEHVARQHCPRWAASLWVLATRATQYRPRTAVEILARVARDLAHYGYARADLDRVCAGITHDEPLAPRMTAGGLWESLLVARLPDESARAAAIVASGVVVVGNGG